MKKNLYARIGIYFHMSFPSSDVFKVIPKSDELINYQEKVNSDNLLDEMERSNEQKVKEFEDAHQSYG